MTLPDKLVIRQEVPYAIAEAENAEEFLGALSPVTGFGAKLPHRSLIYRGQGDASWSLTPKSRRQTAWPLPMANAQSDTLLNRLIAEGLALATFCEVADRNGLAIPNHRQLVKALWDAIGHLGKGDLALSSWPPLVAVPALALAQHHGLPTSLLDFTWNPYVAAYFAARDCLEKKDKRGNLCVWIIDDAKTVTDGRINLMHADPDRPVILLVPPASDNRTLQAQEGLFVYSPLSKSQIKQAAETYAADDPLEACFRADEQRLVLIKLLLRAEHAELLMHKLVKLGYDSARLYPTYEGAVKCVFDHDWSRIGPRFFYGF